jgi:thimet oligopeptidase
MGFQACFSSYRSCGSLQVKEFLERISKRISVLAAKELTKLRAMKKAEEGNDLFGMADLRYYIRKAEEEEFKVDYETVKQYFPMAVVTAGLLQIYQDLLGLKFKEVPNPQVWHPDVQLYSVSDSETGERMGYFYLDLYPR